MAIVRIAHTNMVRALRSVLIERGPRGRSWRPWSRRAWSGCLRPIRVVSPPGRVANVDYPGLQVAGKTKTRPHLASIVIAAKAKPERGVASESCTGANVASGGNHPSHDEYFACYDIASGGKGGRFGEDLAEGYISAEAAESDYGWKGR